MIDEPVQRLDEGALRARVPRVLAGLVRRGEDFDAARRRAGALCGQLPALLRPGPGGIILELAEQIG